MIVYGQYLTVIVAFNVVLAAAHAVGKVVFRVAAMPIARRIVAVAAARAMCIIALNVCEDDEILTSCYHLVHELLHWGFTTEEDYGTTFRKWCPLVVFVDNDDLRHLCSNIGTQL
jgi:hypothetical protein